MRYILFLLCLVAPMSYAAWVGPTQVLSGGWGSGETEFYVDWGDTPTYAVLPALRDVSSSGAVVIADSRNGRIKIYGADGDLVRNITPPVDKPTRWGMYPRFIGANVYLPLFSSYFFSPSGELVVEFETPDKMKFWGERDGTLYLFSTQPNNRWLTYSATGNLLNTVTEKPLELGRIAEDLFIYQGEKLRRVTVSFPNREWVIAGSEGSCGEYSYFVDNAGFLHCLDIKKVVRYSACGVPIATLNMPQDNIATIETAPAGSGAEDFMEVVEGFGSFEIADNGDLYTSRVTQENFSVVRWKWQSSPDDPVGGPDAPVELTATANDNAIALRWIPSLQDPGCVTGYEVGRATTAGGSYTALTTVAKAGVDEPYTYTDDTAQTGTTYYYAVRAVSAIANSPYSTEVSAQIQ